MQSQGVSKEIDGKTYTMFTLPPMESHDLLVDFSRMAVPGIGPIVDAVFGGAEKGKGGFDQELGPDFFTRAARVLAESLDKETLKRMISEFAKVTIVKESGKLNEIFDAHFAGRLPAMYLWLGWGIEVQWGGLLGALKSSSQLQSAFEGLRSKSPTDSTSG